MRKIAVADSETDPFKKGRLQIRPFLWGFYDGEIYKEFEQTIDFVNYIFDQNIIVYAHNGGKFDWHFLLDYIEPFEEIMIINGRISKFKIGKCEFRDSYNILPTPLSAYQKTKISYDIFEEGERDKPENKQKIREYLKDDCLFLYSYVRSFIDRFGLNLTLAGTAMKQWQEISGLTPPRDEGGALYAMLKKYYYGGRCQSFEYGIIDEPFDMVDIKSAYPYAMQWEHPLSTTYYTIDNYGEFCDHLDYESGGFFITCKARSTGCFPIRGDDKSLYYPDDNVIRTFSVTGWEIKAAIKTNTLHDFEFISGYGFYYHTSFKDYILHYYEERQSTNDKAMNIFCKLLMNSLYGKFGSNPSTYSKFKTAPTGLIDKNGIVADEDGGQWEYSGEFGPHHLIAKNLDEEEMRFYNIATAASITGFVRAYLWTAICECEGVLYCDTDSIAAKKIGSLPSGFGDNLGQWEYDGHFKKGAFAGRKLYAMEHLEPVKGKDGEMIYHKIACKGAKLTAEQIFRVANGETVTYEADRPTFSVHSPPRLINKKIKMNKKVLQST